MLYNATERAKEARAFFDKVLNDHIAIIAELANVDPSCLIKINPVDFLEKNKFQKIDGYEYKDIRKWIEENKTDGTFLISPLDAVEETAAQIGYKSETTVSRKIRASKCEIFPIPKETALDFFIRNHRQSLPNISNNAVCLGLLYKNELVAVMEYDTTSGAVRGVKKGYELVRLAIAKNTQVHGGASKLQKACEGVLAQMGVDIVFSYSNATINNGAVYEKLGFMCKNINRGQPFVITEDNKIVRLITLHPFSTDEHLAKRGQLLTHIGGNKYWEKDISQGTQGGNDG